MIASETDIRHGSQIGRFVVVGELGSGGMGIVYAAHDRELDRQVALKVLRAAAATEEERMRMLREGQAMARVTHPNVITVYEVGVEGNLVFLAQELLDAGTLGQWLAKKPRSHAEIIDKFVAAGHGLAAAHAAALVHRDFKPDNVLLGKDGRVRVSDFGLARAIGPADEGLPAATRANMARAQLDLSSSPMSPLTRTGAVMGTPMFMAPEQHNGDPADERSDQFAFCVALYHALYGDYPFAGKTAVALADAVLDGRMQPPPRGHHVSARLRRILLRGLSRQPADRYPSMQALLADLTRPPQHRFRTAIFVTAGISLVVAAVVVGYALRTRDEAVDRPPPLAVSDPALLTNDRGIEWLATAIERGELDNAAEKYDMAGALAQQNNEAPHASIARSAGALVLALRGHLDQARAHLHDAAALKGTDPTARAYADMASAAVAFASGELAAALGYSASCAAGFSTTVPELAAMCLELDGEIAAERGDVTGARKAYTDGLALAKRLDNASRALTLEIALATLDVDRQEDAAAAIAKGTQLQVLSAQRNASSDEAHAWVVLARAHLAQAASQQALEDLDHVKLDATEAFQIQIESRIARGETVAMLDDPDEGFTQIDAARADAEKQGFPGLVFAARLARVEVMIARSAPDAAAAQHALVTEARAKGYERIAHLAETIAQR